MPKKKTTEEFINEVQKKLGNDYKVLGDYINNKTKIKMKHSCGYEYEARPHDILQKGTGCPKCNGGVEKTLNDLLYSLSNDYTYIKGFKNFTTPVTIQHSCGYQYEMLPKYIVRGRGCPKCGGTKKLTHEEFIEKIQKFSDYNEYEFLDRYVNYTTKLRVKHLSCNKIFEISPEHFLRGQRCTLCDRNMSLGSKRIYKFLKNNGIEFETEVQFEGFKSKNGQEYKYDFYIPRFNLIIEYDGQQHFYEKAYGKRAYNNTRKNDLIKNKFVEEHEISLLRISYRDESKLEDILDLFLKQGKSSETIEKFNVFFISEDSDRISNEKQYYLIE